MESTRFPAFIAAATIIFLLGSLLPYQAFIRTLSRGI
jgi:hypothetical protein